MATTLTTVIKNVFDTTQDLTTYEIAFDYYTTIGDNISSNVVTIKSYNIATAASTTLATVYTGSDNAWYSVYAKVQLTTANYKSMQLIVTGQTIYLPGASFTLYLRNLKIDKIKKAEVQDSDLTSGGRRFSYYEGSKMTSQDFNIDSPDTVDGGPVIVVNTVSPNTPSSSPIGTSTAQEGRAIVNRSPSSNAS